MCSPSAQTRKNGYRSVATQDEWRQSIRDRVSMRYLPRTSSMNSAQRRDRRRDAVPGGRQSASPTGHRDCTGDNGKMLGAASVAKFNGGGKSKLAGRNTHRHSVVPNVVDYRHCLEPHSMRSRHSKLDTRRSVVLSASCTKSSARKRTDGRRTRAQRGGEAVRTEATF